MSDSADCAALRSQCRWSACTASRSSSAIGSQRGSVATSGSASPSAGTTSSIAERCYLFLVVTKADRSTEQFRTECLKGLHRAEALRSEIVASSARTIDEALDRYNQLLTAASASNALAGLMSEVHPEEAIRDVAREC